MKNRIQNPESRIQKGKSAMRSLAGFALLLCCLGFSLGQEAKDTDKPEPPVRLKKKLKQPKADEPDKKADDKPDAKAEEKQPEKKKLEPTPRKEGKEGKGDDAVPDDEPDAKEVVARISKNMRSSEDRLAKKDPGDGTKQIQRDILKDLDSLIEQSKRQQQQQQQQQQDNDNDRNQQQQDQKNQQKSSKQKQKDQSAAKKSGQQEGKDKEKQKGQGNNAQGGGTSPDGSKIADLYKDIWGHLPETLRQEMDAYSREQFMAKYQELLKQYYATIAEKGRKARD